MAKKPVKVSQATIDKIKKMGMTAALKKAGTSKNAEYVEGIRRMYGAKRLAAVQKTSGPKAASSSDAARAKYKPAAAKSADAAKAMATKPAKPMNPKGLFPGLLTGNYKSNPKGLFPGLLTGNYKSNSKPAPKQKSTAAQKAYGKARAGGR